MADRLRVDIVFQGRLAKVLLTKVLSTLRLYIINSPIYIAITYLSLFQKMFNNLHFGLLARSSQLRCKLIVPNTSQPAGVGASVGGGSQPGVGGVGPVGSADLARA